MRSTAKVGGSGFEDQARALLARCRASLDPGDPGWEVEVGTAIARDAALVKDLDALLAT